MQRHISLVSLSRDHHGALILARLIQKDAPAYKSLPSTVEGKAAYGVKYYQEHLVKHFEQEEKALAFIKGTDKEMDAAIESIFSEHTSLRLLFGSVSGHKDLQNHLHETGMLLEKHIRTEERELFPLMQEICNEEQLTKIKTLLDAGNEQQEA
ncbi:MAG: hemerythrin domain-containing protein [Ferruginibacter sp.]